jgi:hypothetical protein
VTPAVVWRGRQSRHSRRYNDSTTFPYVVRFGNTRLTLPSFHRTYAGARLRAFLHCMAGVPSYNVWIEKGR